MDDNSPNRDTSLNRWMGGILVPGFFLLWGVSSLVSREIVIPIQRFRSLPIYDHIPVHGWAAVFISLGLISIGLCMHFKVVWSRYQQWERLASVAVVCTGWAAGIAFAIGFVMWLIKTFAGLTDFFR
jgi:hypothetical protein